MSKILQGKVTSNKMQGTAIVEVSWRVPHPLYKKLLNRSKKYKVDIKGEMPKIGQIVKIIETRPISKDKHFALLPTVKTIEPSIKTKPAKIKTKKV